METYRLKNIAIVILLLLNGCLLLTVGYQRLQAHQAESRTAEQLRLLCQSSQLMLGEELDLTRQPLDVLLLSRRAETEQAIASSLLGSDAASASQGGGIYSYRTERGVIQFRAGGSFYGSRLAVPVEDPETFAKAFCRRFGYETPAAEITGGSGTATATQLLAGVPVEGCEVALHFEEGVLVSVTGAHVDLEDASAEPGKNSMTCITALVKFLDYRNASGAVCSEVRDVFCVYQLQGPASPQLLPVWQIETDTYTYFVNCQTGEVTGR